MIVYVLTGTYSYNAYADTADTHGVFTTMEKAVQAQKYIEENSVKLTQYGAFAYATIEEVELDMLANDPNKF